MTIPSFLARYFWDVDFKALNTERQSTFMIERILEKGDESAVQWLREAFNSDEISRVANSSKRLSPKSRNYWGLIYNLWSTQNQSILPRGGIWQR